MVFRRGIKSSDALEVIEVIIRLLCAKHIRVVRSTKACTDGKGLIELPPLPPDSTEEDQVLFLGYGLHEGAHFTAGSVPALMSKDMLHRTCENGVDDVRVESDQEGKHAGITYWRKLWYQIFFDKELSKTFPVQTKKKIADFLHKLICLMIFRTRSQQLDINLSLNPSVELQEAYDEYLLDLEVQVKACKTFEDALRVGVLVYKRIKKLIKDDAASKTPEPKKPEKKEKKDDKEPNDSDKKDSGGDSGFDESDTKTSPDPSGSEAEDTEGEDSSEKEGAPGVEEDTKKPEDSAKDVTPGEAAPESDNTSAKDSTGGDEDKEEGSSDPDAAAEAEYKEACKERERKIEEETERVLREIEGSPEDFKMPIEIWAEEVNRVICKRSGPYMVSKDVKDVIAYVPEGNMEQAEGIKKVGINLLGTKGDSMTRLFVSQTRERTVYNQRSGSFDMMSFMQDVSDSRMDLYTEEMPGCLDKAAISFMMDNSSSMRDSIGTAYALLSGFMHYLCRAAIPVEAVGFTASINRNPEYRVVPVHLQIIKKFEDAYDGKVIRRCVPPRYMDQNAEVDCLRWMVPRLLKRKEGKKILFVVGDGQPCIGCDEINEKLAYAYKEYLELCRQAGIIVFGFGISCDLSEYFGEDFLSVETSDMGDIILKKLTEILNRKRVTA